MSDRAIISSRAILAFAFVTPAAFIGWTYAIGMVAGLILGAMLVTHPEGPE